jgi:hypothetical protein
MRLTNGERLILFGPLIVVLAIGLVGPVVPTAAAALIISLVPLTILVAAGHRLLDQFALAPGGRGAEKHDAEKSVFTTVSARRRAAGRRA